MTKLTGFSSTYVSESENGWRMATVSYLNSIKNNLMLSDEDKKVLLLAYNRDRLNVNDDLLYYLIDNDLVESLEIIRKFDEFCDEIKKIAKKFQCKAR